MTRSALLPSQTCIHYFLQTLTTLNLAGNKIGPKGAEHLSNALEQNKVVELSTLYIRFNRLFAIFHRHLLHLISLPVESVRKDLNIL
jgi:hypothetical protein